MTCLALLQLVSPALPVGAFGYSEGLEVLVQASALCNASDVEQWLRAELQRGSVRIETASLRLFVHDLARWSSTSDSVAYQSLIELDHWLLTMRDASELRAQQCQMGMALIELMAEMGHPLPQSLPLSWPAAWAWAAYSLEVPQQEMVEGYLYGWVANQLSAAVRLVPLGPTSAQVLQLRLSSLIKSQAGKLFKQDPRQLWSAGLGASMAQLAHAELYSRLFRS
jgi:urease accessory protein